MNVFELLQKSALELTRLKSTNAQLMSDLVLTLCKLNTGGQRFVICVTPSPYLNLGKVYEPFDERENDYYLLNEKGNYRWFPKTDFISINDAIITPEPVKPSTREATILNLSIGSRGWNVLKDFMGKDYFNRVRLSDMALSDFLNAGLTVNALKDMRMCGLKTVHEIENAFKKLGYTIPQNRADETPKTSDG